MFLFILLQLPFGVSALVLQDPLTAQTRGMHTISNYEQMDLGRAGELRLNEYNQELLLTREELSLAGGNLPVRLQRIYHSYPTGQNSVGLMECNGASIILFVCVMIRQAAFLFMTAMMGAGPSFRRQNGSAAIGFAGGRPRRSAYSINMASERVNRRVTSQNENDPRNLSKL